MKYKTRIQRIGGLLLSLLLMITMVGSATVFGADVTEFVFSEVMGDIGEEIAVPVRIYNNPGIATFRFRIAFDMSMLSLVAVECGEVSDNGEMSSLVNFEKETVTFLWYSLTDVKGDGTVAILRFRVLKEIVDDRPLTVTYLPEDVLNDESETVPYSVTVKAFVPVGGVTMDRTSLALDNVTQTSETLRASVLPHNATCREVIWKSSDPSVATVDENGMVTSKGLGTATVTVTTKEGGFVASCTVLVRCAHPEITKHAAVESTCVIQGNNAYSTCNICGVITAGSDEKLPLSDKHIGGTATCLERAVCERCGQLYGTYAPHILKRHAYVAPNHNSDGNIEYWTCAVCEKHFRDSMGTEVILQADTVLEKVPHTWENACDPKCDACGAVREITHEYAWVVDKEATCGVDGYKHEECVVCHTKRNENTAINATGDHTWDNGCDAECDVCGETRAVDHVWDNACDMICNVCGQWRAIEHSYSGVCDVSCNVCGVVREALVTHTWDNGCDTECNVCGGTREITHEYAWVVDKEPTCGVNGYKHEECAVCHAKRNENTAIDATGLHTWDNGCDTACNVCGAVREITHDYAWVVDKEATCGVEGKKHEECAVCHTKRNENTVIAATGDHTYTDDRDAECDVCGFMREVSVLGDVNGDNKIDSTDARLVLQYAVGKIGKDAINIAVADVNADNKIDSTDARLILQYAVGKIQVFPNAG